MSYALIVPKTQALALHRCLLQHPFYARYPAGFFMPVIWLDQRAERAQKTGYNNH